MATMTEVNTYEQQRMKEDVSDIVANISPTKTPVLSMLEGGTAHNTKIEWTMDQLAEAKAGTGVVEGAPAGAAVMEVVDQRYNYTQIFKQVAKATGTAEATDWYGVANQLAYQMTKKAAEMKRDIEATLVNKPNLALADIGGLLPDPGALAPATDTISAGSTTTPRRMANFRALVWDNPFGEGRTCYDAGGVPMDEDKWNSALQNVWTYGGELKYAIVTPNVSRGLAKFALDSGTGLAGRFRDSGQEKTLVNVVNFYVSDFGDISIAIDRFFPATGPYEDITPDTLPTEPAACLFIDPEYAKVRYLRNPQVEDLAKTGDSEDKMIICEASLEVSTADAHGFIYNFNVATPFVATSNVNTSSASTKSKSASPSKTASGKSGGSDKKVA